MTSDERAAWYEEWFDTDEYEVVYRRRDEGDARRLLSLILRVTDLPAGARVLDMACGRGRHSVLLAKEGFRVFGIDLSTRAIEKARRTAAAESLSIEFEVGDMREAPCTSCFDMVVNLFTSFGYFEQDKENALAVEAMAAALVDAGWLVQDYLNGRYWSTNFVPFDERSVDGITIQQRRWVERRRLIKEIVLTHEDGRTDRFMESVRLYELEDFRRMYRRAGLQIERVFGDSAGSAFADDSQRLILFSRRSA